MTADVIDRPAPTPVRSGRLQRMPGRFARHARGGQLSQMIVDERQESLRRLGVATLDPLEDERDFAGVHAGESSRAHSGVKAGNGGGFPTWVRGSRSRTAP